MINYTSYTLTDKNFYSEIHEKKQIVIGNSFNLGMDHFVGWKNRLNGHYKKVSNFTIDTDGNIYQHFDPNYYSEFLNNSLHNKNIISVVLVNQGWFDYDVMDKKFINYMGISYTGNNMTEKRWRNHSFWENYTEKQMESLSLLTNFLLEKFNIPKKVITHNTHVKDIYNFAGVSYRSNWVKDCTDLSPSFDFEIFKNKVEYNGIQ
jgi:N-acetyl-anhydromuramyl-L-alanine amidase AmpD